MPIQTDPRTGRKRWVPQTTPPKLEFEDGEALDPEPEVPAIPAPEDPGVWKKYAPMAVRGLTALVPGGPWGAAAGAGGEAVAQIIESDEPFNWAQITAQGGLGAVPFGRVPGLLRAAAKASAHGAVGGAGTELAEQVHSGDYDLGKIGERAKFGAVVGGAAGGAGYGVLRRFLGASKGTAEGGARIRRAPGARAEFDVEGTPAAVGTRPSLTGGDRPATSRIPYRGPLEARESGPATPLGEFLEASQEAAARGSRIPGGGPSTAQTRTPYRMPEQVGPRLPVPAGLPTRAPTLEDELSKILEEVRRPAPAARVSAASGPPRDPIATASAAESRARQMLQGRAGGGPENTLAAPANPIAAAPSVAASAEIVSAAPSPLGRLFRVTAPEFRDIQAGRERLADKTAGLSLPAGMRDQIDRMGLESRRTQTALQELRQTPNADLREVQRMEQAARELGSRLAGMEREAVRLAKTQVPVISGGAPEPPVLPAREGHFTLPETKVSDAEYDAVRRMLGIEESPLAQAERRMADVGSPTGTERRGLDPRVSGVMDERGAMSPELAANLGTGVLGAGIGAWQAEPEDRLRDTALGALAGFFVPELARRDPDAFRKLEQWRAGAMLSGGAQVKNILGNVGSVGYESARRALAGDPTTAKNLMREFFSPRTLTRAREAFADPTIDFQRGTSPRGGPLAVFGKTMGATDAATRGAMETAGLTAEEARRAVLTADPATEEGRRFLSYHNASPLARFFVPFARTNVNQLERFAETVRDAPQVLESGAVSRDALARLLLAGGTGVAGYELGQEYPNATPFLTAAAGPAGVPFLAGATMGRLTDEGAESGDVLRGVAREIGRNMPLATDYSMDPSRWLASYVPNFLRIINPDTKRRDTRGSIFGPSLAKIPFLSETLPER